VCENPGLIGIHRYRMQITGLTPQGASEVNIIGCKPNAANLFYPLMIIIEEIRNAEYASRGRAVLKATRTGVHGWQIETVPSVQGTSRHNDALERPVVTSGSPAVTD
jgi:hypothetical protein